MSQPSQPVQVRLPFNPSWQFKGQPILDIEAWARGRGERMVPFRHTKRYYDLFTRQQIEEVEEGTMPESFFQSMRLNEKETLTEIVELKE